MVKVALFLALALQVFALELGMGSEVDRNSSIAASQPNVALFGANLFNGSFTNNRQYRYNPRYRVSIGDTIVVKMWGALDMEIKSSVDTQGNIFIPKVGTINVLGIRNDKLSEVIQKEVKKVFKKSVFVYADLASYQPVSVFVTGAVNKPGLYEGLSSDSVVQFLDKANGIDLNSGSFRNVKVLRDNRVIEKIDLYKFLIEGNLELFQFHNGDVIVVESIKNYIDVTGDVKRAYRFEILEDEISFEWLLSVAIPNPTATNFTVTRWSQNNLQTVSMYAIKDSAGLKVKSGDLVNFIPDHNPENIEITISGEHIGARNLVVKKGTSLKEVFEKISFSNLSDPSSFQLFRKSVAQQQKELLEAQLKDLEAKVLTTGSMTNEEALIRKQEAALVMNFIERARKVEPKGHVVINKDTNLSEVILEDKDEIYIPKKSKMVIVQGEVVLPGAQTYVDGMKLEEYIDSCGGYTFRADKDNVLIVRRNGYVDKVDASSWSGSKVKIMPGDSILVLGKVDTKHLQVVKDITQIVYQIAVGAAVVLRY